MKIIAYREFVWPNLLTDIGWAVLIMGIGYGIVVGTRSLSLFIDFGIMPGITKRIINKNVVARTEYDDLLRERDNYVERYEEERKNGRVLSKVYDEQLIEVREKNKLEIEANDLITKLNKNITT